jgi:hypothetical protein
MGYTFCAGYHYFIFPFYKKLNIILADHTNSWDGGALRRLPDSWLQGSKRVPADDD